MSENSDVANVRKFRKKNQNFENFKTWSESADIFVRLYDLEIIVGHFHPLPSYRSLITESKTPYISRAKVEKIRAQMCFVPMQIAAI